MNCRRPPHVPSLLLGAALVVVGYFIGIMQSDKTAYAQTTVNGLKFFVSGGPAIITSSNDGKTLHFWSTTITPEIMNPSNKPQYVGKVEAQ